MSTIARIPTRLDRMTLEECEAPVASGAFRGRNRFPLINGCLVEKTTRNPPHPAADLRCGRERLRVVPRGRPVRSGKLVRIARPGRDSEPEPDRCVVRRRPDDHADRHPDPGDIAPVVEIADSSLTDDREGEVPSEPLQGAWLAKNPGISALVAPSSGDLAPEFTPMGGLPGTLLDRFSKGPSRP